VAGVIACGLDFVKASDEIPSGWTTFQLKNASTMIHFAVLERFPNGVGVEEQKKEEAPVFQEGMDWTQPAGFETPAPAE